MSLFKFFRTQGWGLAYLFAFCFSFAARSADVETTDRQSGKAIDPVLAIKQFKAPDNFKIDLFAAEPQLQSPVALTIDEHGRIYVAETFRLNDSVYDIRGHMHMYSDDLACRTVEDHLAVIKKYLGDHAGDLAVKSEVIRLLEDRSGTGRADFSQVYADGFNTMLDGLGAGVLARKGKLYYTDMPNLWLLEGTNASGQVAARKSLSYGYGVRFGYAGHDLHGLRIGPDGKLYFSSGDRGLHVTTKEGKVLDNSESGAVLRCNLDGSDLEIFATGLRNPQELAFDDHGNLFTGDNNCDHGDAARLVYVVEGGDSGWRVSYQFSDTTEAGLWNSESLWHTNFPQQAAYIVPPVAYIADGPSGIAHYPGTGFPAAYDNHFFLCDFRGGSVNSGVHTFAAEPQGAGFEMVDHSHFFWHILSTDVEFGPDGGMYVSDWVQGWNASELGRIYRLYDPQIARSALVLETKRLIAEGMEKRSVDELEKLLAHADQRVRQEAQFELVDRVLAPMVDRDTASVVKKRLQYVHGLTRAALGSKNALARLHGIWGLGQMGCATNSHAAVITPLLTGKDALPPLAGKNVVGPIMPLLKDPDAEVRAQTAKVLGDARATFAFAGLTNALTDSNLRVRFFAAQSLGKLGNPQAVAPLLEMLRANADRDVFLRHAGIMGLLGTADHSALMAAAKDDSRAVRMAALLVMRRRQMPEVAGFLKDSDRLIVTDAARAISDLPIPDALPHLAAMIEHPTGIEKLDWRIINANERVGGDTNAQALAAYAARTDAPETLRSEAVRALSEWTKPSPRDRVTGLWRPLPERNGEPAATALRSVFKQLMATAPDSVKQMTVQAARDLAMADTAPIMLATAETVGASPHLRVAALDALSEFHDGHLAEAVKMAIADNDATVRAAGNRLQAEIKPSGAADTLAAVVENGKTLGEKQSALATLGKMDGPVADAVLAVWLDKLIAGKVPREMQLDVLEAASKRHSDILKSKLESYVARQPKDDEFAGYRETLFGGDADAGKKIFFERPEASCVRCHKVKGEGGMVGPDLTGIITRHDREYILESILFPNKVIAPGFESIMVEMKAGQTYAGIVKSQDDQVLNLYSVEDNAVVKLNKSEILKETKGQSPMPEGIGKILSKQDFRNLVEYLATAN